MIEIIKGGNLLDASQIVIAHQINCRSVMGSGVALAIKNKYPQHYRDFMMDNHRTPEEKLGTIIKTITNTRIIFGLYGQLDYKNRNVCNTDYQALNYAIQVMVKDCKLNGINNIALPYLLGCGLAGGDWNVVSRMLAKISDIMEINIHLYDLLNQSEEELLLGN